MSEQTDIEAALARATAAYKNVRAELDALKAAADRAEAAEAENDRLREECSVFMASNASLTNRVLDLRDERDRLREALTEIANRSTPGDEARVLALAALAKKAGQ